MCRHCVLESYPRENLSFSLICNQYVFRFCLRVNKPTYTGKHEWFSLVDRGSMHSCKSPCKILLRRRPSLVPNRRKSIPPWFFFFNKYLKLKKSNLSNYQVPRYLQENTYEENFNIVYSLYTVHLFTSGKQHDVVCHVQPSAQWVA